MIHNSKFLNTSIIVLNGMKELGKVRSCLDLFLVFKRAQFVHGQSTMLAFAIGHHSMLYLLEDTIELLWQLANRQLSHLNIYYRINVHFTPFKFSPSPNNPYTKKIDYPIFTKLVHFSHFLSNPILFCYRDSS
jgi:hypothetical protein